MGWRSKFSSTGNKQQNRISWAENPRCFTILTYLFSNAWRHSQYLWDPKIYNPFVCVCQVAYVWCFASLWPQSLPGSSVHGILQARILEQLAIPSSKGSCPPRDRTRVSCIVGRRFTVWATREGAGSSNSLLFTRITMSRTSLWSSSHNHTWVLERPQLWLYGSLSAKWYLCSLICCPGLP